MRIGRMLALLVPALLLAGPARFARLGELDGRIEVRLSPADPWISGERNLPLPEGALIQSAAGSRAEIEFDDGGVWRILPESLAEISDYTSLSSGQRITVLSLDRGLAYYTGRPAAGDSVILNVPGAQAAIRQGARLRLEARETWSWFGVFEGAARYSSPTAEFDLREGQTVRLEPANPARFQLDREVAPLETDNWNEDRDKALAAPRSAAHIGALRCGAFDLDAAGTWLSTDQYGTIWLPKAVEGWAPYRHGRWLWYDAVGYTWVSADPWGWLPYHHGRWVLIDKGWAWAPPSSPIFKPGEVYWLRGVRLAGWGPLAPAEDYTGSAVPRLFLNAHTTYATFQADARTIDPAGFATRPDEPLKVAAFVPALPSPAFAAMRLEAGRPELRAGRARVPPVLPGTTYEARPESAAVVAPHPPPPVAVAPQFPPAPIVVVTPPSFQQPAEVVYVAPVYTGIVVMNPPERSHDAARDRRRRPATPGPATAPAKKTEPQPKTDAKPETPPPADPAPTPPDPAQEPDVRRRAPSSPPDRVRRPEP
jgi:hypothetical protein